MDAQQIEINRRFGREVNRQRRLKRYTQLRLANEVGVSQTHMGNIERGKRTPDLRLVADVDRALEADGRLERLWATLAGDGEPVWLDDLANLERHAVSIMESHEALFPALLQTEDYARSVVQTVSPCASQDEVKAAVKARMDRAQRFISATSPTYRAVLDKSILNGAWGGHGVMAGQLSHVVELLERGRVSIQIVGTGCHAGLAGPFTLIASPTSPDVVYVESADSGRMIDDPVRVQQFRVLFSDIQSEALSRKESLQLLRDELERLNHG
ncbi:helix-turn-helix domain-containing protein [Allosalinactinospora lopnorensis]|uniref:helix-turn-helix domain-containing protein n=1 Tax=Allosalinactinospora lopnorensis TaxID=1352348 RepID=UPI000699013F|nr:helix-turn-helix transcriptional regulator [Allosalinactinospora lopnorensis]